MIVGINRNTNCTGTWCHKPLNTGVSFLTQRWLPGITFRKLKYIIMGLLIDLLSFVVNIITYKNKEEDSNIPAVSMQLTLHILNVITNSCGIVDCVSTLCFQSFLWFYDSSYQSWHIWLHFYCGSFIFLKITNFCMKVVCVKYPVLLNKLLFCDPILYGIFFIFLESGISPQDLSIKYRCILWIFF